MKTALTILVALVAPLAMTTKADDKTAINQLYQDWRDAVHGADIKAYVSVLADDVRLIPPGADPIDSASEYAAFLEPVFLSANYRIEVVAQPVIDVVDDIAVAEYSYTIHLEMKEDAPDINEPGALTASVTHARYFDVLKKDDTGNWKVWRHTWQ